MPEPPSSRAARAAAERQARRDREAAALRENLRKRKEQARIREGGEPPAKPEPPPQSWRPQS